MTNMKNSFTVVTVNYNNEEGLKKTIESVKEVKERNNIYYIVVDGDSTDGSLEIIKNTKEIDVYISGPDKGPFDAMNKGVMLACTDWICMLNSGDTFVDGFDVSKVFELNLASKNVVIGRWLKNGCLNNPRALASIKYGIMPCCHQAMLIRKSFHYNLKYKIYSDFELLANIYRSEPCSIQITDLLFCNYEGGGLSDKVSFRKRYEKYLVILKYFGLSCLIKAFFFRTYQGFFLRN